MSKIWEKTSQEILEHISSVLFVKQPCFQSMQKCNDFHLMHSNAHPQNMNFGLKTFYFQLRNTMHFCNCRAGLPYVFPSPPEGMDNVSDTEMKMLYQWKLKAQARTSFRIPKSGWWTLLTEYSILKNIRILIMQ